MKEVMQHPIYGEIIYNESFWTGKKELTVNGVCAQRISKKEYAINEKKIILKGNYLTGISLSVEDENIQLSSQPKWYELVLALLPFLFLIIWGNNATLCAIFPVIGGALGGAFGGIATIVSMFFMKKQKSLPIKLVVGIAVLIATIFIAFIIANLLILLIS